MDYQSNSKKSKDPVPDKKIEKVVTGAVVVKKQSFGEKVKAVFVEADFRSVARYVVSDVLIPAARNMIVDASTKGIERMMYGDRTFRQRGGSFGQQSRMTYGGSPIQRVDYRHPNTRPPSQMGPAYPRSGRHDFILDSRDEANEVLQKMHDILEMYDVVSVADLHELVGEPLSTVDQKWGWVNLVESQVQPVRGGYLVLLPPAEPL